MLRYQTCIDLFAAVRSDMLARELHNEQRRGHLVLTPNYTLGFQLGQEV